MSVKVPYDNTDHWSAEDFIPEQPFQHDIIYPGSWSAVALYQKNRIGFMLCNDN